MVEAKIEVRETYLWAALTGDYVLSESVEATREILRVAKESNRDKVLLDVRELNVGVLSTTERFEIGTALVDLLNEIRPHAIKIAYINLEERLDPDMFDQTVARNRGAEAIVTADEAEALAWLGV